MFHPLGPSFFELARQALSSTECGYDLLAAKFDHTPFRTPDRLLSQVAPYISALGPIGSALDVCCGTGAAMEMLRPLCSERVVGVDFSQSMLDVGSMATRGAPGLARLEFVRANVLEMSFDQEFDMAVCFGAMGHILPRDQFRFLGQVKRSLRPDGRLVLLSSYTPPRSSRIYWQARMFNAAMHVRNKLISPPFIMYYMTFLLPNAANLLSECGFEVQVKEDVFTEPWENVCMIIARNP